MPNSATVSVIINTKDVVNKMIQGVAAYQYERDCFQNVTYKYFTSTSNEYRQDFNVGDFVQFTGRLVCENETLYITLVGSTLLCNRSSESHVPDNELLISTPSMTTTVVLASLPKKLSNQSLDISQNFC